MKVSELLTEHVWFDAATIKKFAALVLSKEHKREDQIEFENTKFICTLPGKNSIHWRMLENDFVLLRPTTYITIHRDGKEAGTASIIYAPSRNNSTKEYVYDPKLYLKTQLNLEDMSHDSVIKKLLILYKDCIKGGFYAAKRSYVKKILTVARQAGYKSPELDAISKSFKSL